MTTEILYEREQRVDLYTGVKTPNMTCSEYARSPRRG